MPPVMQTMLGGSERRSSPSSQIKSHEVPKMFQKKGNLPYPLYKNPRMGRWAINLRAAISIADKTNRFMYQLGYFP